MVNKPTIVITGANGFLGGCLLEYFRKKEWLVKALVHRIPDVDKEGVTYFQYSMENELEASCFEGVDFLVHAAYLRYEKDSNAAIVNLEGTRELIDICLQKNIKMVFLSSFSAHENAISNYGKIKLECEKLFDISKDVILKIGFVIGEKGILSEMIQRMKNSSFFPLVGGGKQPLQSIYIEDLCQVVEHVLIKKELFGVFNIAHHQVITMKQFYKNLADRLGRKLTFIPIPTSLLFMACRFFEILKINIPVSSESVLGLKKLITLETLKDQEKIEMKFKSYEEGLDLILRKNEL